jgi:hypothetical protein
MKRSFARSVLGIVVAASLSLVATACEGRGGDAPPSDTESSTADARTDVVGSCANIAPSSGDGAPTAIAPTPCLAVGVLTGDPNQEFDRVTTPFLLSDGSLAVPTVGAGSIRIFGSDGRFVRELGRRGQGPGEIDYLASAWPRGDTIEAFDLTQQRLVRFLPSDSVETLPMREATATGFLGPLGAGWATFGLRARMGRPIPRDSVTVRFTSRNADGFTVTQLAITDGMARYQAPGISGPHPLTPTSIAVVHADEVYVGETLTPLIRVYHADRTLDREIALPLTAPSTGAATLRQVVDSAVTRALDHDKPMTRERWSAYEELDRLSVFWALIVDELGYLWVRPYDPVAHSLALDGLPSNRGGPGGRWLVLSPTGAEVGWIDIPDGFEPLQITRHAVVGVQRDLFDIEFVHVHRLSRR